MLLGIDLGTSALKLVLLDPDTSEIVAQKRAPVHAVFPAPDRAELDVECVWDALCGLLHRLEEEQRGILKTIRGVGLSVIFPALVPMDNAGKPLARAILYSDRRSQAQVEAFSTAFGRDRLEALTGNRFTPGTSTLPGILWLRDWAPEVYRQTAVFGQISTFFLKRLTGQWMLDLSHASLSGMARAGAEGQWCREILAAAELEPARLPPCCESTTVAGVVSTRAARCSGLPVGIPVTAGCGDAPLAALGGGVVAPGQLFCSAGSTDCLMVSRTTPGGNPVFCNVRYPVPGLWVSIGTMSTAGAAVKWFCEGLMHCTAAEMTAWAEKAPPGAGGVMFLPYLQGERTPHWDPKARGVFAGLTLGSGRAEMARAALEGIACGWRQIVGMLEDECGIRAPEIISVGGGSDNDLWNRIKATLLGRPVRVLEQVEGTGLGAALLAGIAAGTYVSLQQAVKDTTALRRSRVVEPEADWRDACEAAYVRYLKLYPAMAPLFAAW